MNAGSSPPVVAMQLIGVPFLLFGLLAPAAARWRSDAVPQGAVLLTLAFVVVGNAFLNESLAIAPDCLGSAISLVAACWIAWAVLRAGRAAPAT